MKKLILSSAAVLLISLSVFAGNNDKCCKKETKNCTPKECVKEVNSNGSSAKCEFSPDKKCSKDKTQCNTSTASNTSKNTPKN